MIGAATRATVQSASTNGIFVTGNNASYRVGNGAGEYASGHCFLDVDGTTVIGVGRSAQFNNAGVLSGSDFFGEIAAASITLGRDRASGWQHRRR